MLGEAATTKVIGGLLGASLSVTVLFPPDYKEAALRALAGVSAAVLFTDPAAHWLSEGILEGVDKGLMTLPTSGGIGFFAWLLGGIVARTAAKYQTIGDAARDVQDIRHHD